MSDVLRPGTIVCLTTSNVTDSLLCLCVCVLTFSESLPDLVGVSRQVEVGVPGLQVANRTASPRHTKPLNEQVWKKRQHGFQFQYIARC